MHVLSKRTLRLFWDSHPKARAALSVWYDTVTKADWSCWAELRQSFSSADAIGDSRVIFNVGGNKYRIVARISYPFRNVKIKFVGTHAEYDDIDPETV